MKIHSQSLVLKFKYFIQNEQKTTEGVVPNKQMVNGQMKQTHEKSLKNIAGYILHMLRVLNFRSKCNKQIEMENVTNKLKWRE